MPVSNFEHSSLQTKFHMVNLPCSFGFFGFGVRNGVSGLTNNGYSCRVISLQNGAETRSGVVLKLEIKSPPELIPKLQLELKSQTFSSSSSAFDFPQTSLPKTHSCRVVQMMASSVSPLFRWRCLQGHRNQKGYSALSVLVTGFRKFGICI